MAICGKCKRDKPDHLFKWRDREKTKKRTICSVCVNAYKAEWLRRTPERYAKHRRDVKKRRDSIVKAVQAFKAGRPCADCGGMFNTWQMQFDHVTGVKIGAVSSIAGLGSLRKALDEIKKCDIVCANCHANRTHSRFSEKHRKRL